MKLVPHSPLIQAKHPLLRAAFVLAALLTSCSTTTTQRAQTKPAAPAHESQVTQPAPGEVAEPVALTADTTTMSPLGFSTFTAPATWSLCARAQVSELLFPEPSGRLVLVDVESAKDADSALASAWNLLEGAAPKRTVRLRVNRPAKEGWEEIVAYDYETSPDERWVQYATVLRKGTYFTVLIADAPLPAFERRFAQVRVVHDTVLPKGYERESFANKTAAPLDAARLDMLTRFVESGMRDLEIPGASLALIEHGKVVFSGGFGVRQLGSPARVDADTLFLAGSNTKALTTLLLARLVDAKKLSWEDRVSHIYPKFRLGDAATSEAVCVKHLVCACTGLPRQDFEWLFQFAQATPESEIEALATMQPTTGFGEVFQYSNMLTAMAGYLGGHLTSKTLELGAAYDKAMQSEVFTPLGMKRTTFDFKRALAQNHASGHSDDIEGKVALARMDINHAVVPLRPAGGVWTSANDLARYVALELGRGKLEGKTIVSEESLLARRQKQVALGSDEIYGMGLMVHSAWGIPVVHHGGSLIGYKSDMMFLPDHDVGAVLLTSSDSGGLLLRPFMRRLVEVLFEGTPQAEAELAVRAETRRTAAAKERARLTLTPDAKQLGGLAKRYDNAALGEIVIEASADRLTFNFGEWKSKVATRANDDGTIAYVTIDPGVLGFAFIPAERDGKQVLITRDAQHEYVFEPNTK